MPTRPSSLTRAKTRSRARRLSACPRHPSEPVTGICAACLRERLSGIDPDVPSSTTFLLSSLQKDGDNPQIGGNGPPQLRRCRSVSATKCDGEASCSSSSYAEPRRKSCDVGPRNNKTLAHLFDVDDDEKNVAPNQPSQVESKRLGLTRSVIEESEELLHPKCGEQIRVFHDHLNADVVEEGDGKTMKEFIDLELKSKSSKPRDLREIASVFSKKLWKWRQKQKMKKLNHVNNESDTASNSHNSNHEVLKNRIDSILKGQMESKETRSEVGEYALGRRSCDTEPRFSIDAGRLSVEDSRVPFDEPRASWDGYLIARTIPRLAPMLSVVENGVLGNGNRFESHRISVDGGQMGSIMEDESSSSNGSGQSNSDSSSSQRRSSFDRSSSVRSFGKKTVGLEGDEAKAIANVGVFNGTKLVITEKELKDWRLKSVKDDALEKFESVSKDVNCVESGSNLKISKKALSWRKVCNVFGFKHKLNNNKEGEGFGFKHQHNDNTEGQGFGFKHKLNDSKEGEGFAANVVGISVSNAHEKQGSEAGVDVKEASTWRLTRNSSIVTSRRKSFELPRSDFGLTSTGKLPGTLFPQKGKEDFVLERNKSVRYSPSNFDDGVLPFYMTPLRSTRNSKSGRYKLQTSGSVAGNLVQLN